eukprot:NODE_5875_length_383_cov_147.158683_g5165_i0.p1 GENE.NODE_5875_length_383_cov_147.158683_g5165_i0~~NODE_5875_length_383_cov_147.158683_g5165_i0.p1  ORF type:complete len:59 (-),score=0.70 NODE_5875_length_383_cov_147.158683_g5165_i0:58-234(-)
MFSRYLGTLNMCTKMGQSLIIENPTQCTVQNTVDNAPVLLTKLSMSSWCKMHLAKPCQ